MVETQRPAANGTRAQVNLRLRRWFAYYLLLITYYTTYYILHTTYYLLRTTYYYLLLRPWFEMLRRYVLVTSCQVPSGPAMTSSEARVFSSKRTAGGLPTCP